MPDFDPQKVLIDWKESHRFTIADALAGVSVVGATGSGAGTLLARVYLKNGFGALVFCARPEEQQQWETWARDTGRSADLTEDDFIRSKSFDDRGIKDHETGGARVPVARKRTTVQTSPISRKFGFITPRRSRLRAPWSTLRGRTEVVLGF